MQNYPEALEGLVEELRRLPGIGRKTAERLAFHMVRIPPAQAEALAAAIMAVKNRLQLCSECQNLTESDPCAICRDGGRDQDTLCVVEFPADLASIENSRGYRGRYYVLHGAMAPMQGIGPDELRLEKLKETVRRLGVREVIVATNLTTDGNATAQLLSRELRPLGVLLSRPACGLPVGADLEYMDQVTISRSMEGRHPF